MKSIFLYVIIVALVVLILVIFIMRGKARRHGQKGKNNILKLKPGKANYEFDLDRSLNDGALLKIKQLMDQKKFRIIDGVEDGIIAYSGKNEDAALGGWLNIDPFTLPFRIVVMEDTDHIKVTFADDYGFQILNKSQLQKFNETYRPVFTFYEDLIKKQF